MRRLLLILLILLLLVGAAALAAEIIMRSDLPRRITEQVLQDQLGLGVELDHVRARWGGHVSVQGVRAALPLEDEPFLELDRLELHHTPLLLAAVQLGVEVEAAELSGLTVRAAEQDDGRWNLHQAIQTIQAARPAPRPDRRQRPIPLPRLLAEDVRLEITRRNHPTATIDQVTLHGVPRGLMGYQFALDLPEVGQAELELARAAPFEHRLRYTLAPEPALIEALAGLEDEALEASGVWRGRIEGNQLRGALHLERFEGVGVRSAGLVRVRVGGNPLAELRPAPLRVVLGEEPTPIDLRSGRIVIDSESLSLTALRMTRGPGRVRVDGHLELPTLTGQLRAQWTGLDLPDGFDHVGRLEAELVEAGPIGRRLEADLLGRGSAPTGPWRTRLSFEAEGPSLDDLRGELLASDLEFVVAGEPYAFPGLRVGFAWTGRRLALQEISYGEADAPIRLRGQGRVNLPSGDWRLDVRTRGLRAPALPSPIERMTIQASGDRQRIALDQMELALLGLEAVANGVYVLDPDTLQEDEQPLNLQVQLMHVPIHLAGQEEQPLIQAQTLRGQMELAGTLEPLEIDAQGLLLARQLQVHRENLGDVELYLAGSADPQRIVLAADAIEWLGGDWMLDAYHPLGLPEDPLTIDAPIEPEPTRISVRGEGIDLTLAENILAQPLGLEEGRADVELEAEHVVGQVGEIEMEGRFTLQAVKRQPLEVEEVTGRISLHEGRFRVDELHARQGEGRLEAALGLDLAEPERLSYDVDLRDWPLRIDLPRIMPIDITLGAEGAGELDWRRLSGDGRLGITASAEGGEFDFGSFETSMAIRGGIVSVDAFEGSTLGGRVTGDARLHLQDALASRLRFEADGLHLSELEPLAEPFGQVDGALRGRLTMGQPQERRPLGRSRVALSLDASQMTLGGLPVGAGEASLYLSDDRLVLREMTLEAAGGELSLWGRITQRIGRDDKAQHFAYARGGARELDLEVLTEVLRPDEPSMPGRLTVNAWITGELSPEQFARSMQPGQEIHAVGGGDIELTDSDLVHLPLFGELYALLNAPLGGRQTDGRGGGSFRVDGQALLFERFRYRNRGVDVQMAGRMSDLFRGAQSPIEGYAIASLRPLPELEMLEVLNEALTAAQRGITTLHLGGTLEEPQFRYMPLGGVWGAMRRVIEGGRPEEAAPAPGVPAAE